MPHSPHLCSTISCQAEASFLVEKSSFYRKFINASSDTENNETFFRIKIVTAFKTWILCLSKGTNCCEKINVLYSLTEQARVFLVWQTFPQGAHHCRLGYEHTRACTIKHYRFLTYCFRSKLVRLSKPMRVTDNNNNNNTSLLINLSILHITLHCNVL